MWGRGRSSDHGIRLRRWVLGHAAALAEAAGKEACSTMEALLLNTGLPTDAHEPDEVDLAVRDPEQLTAELQEQLDKILRSGSAFARQTRALDNATE